MNMKLAMSILYPLKEGTDVKELNRSNEVISLLGSLEDMGLEHMHIDVNPYLSFSFSNKEMLAHSIIHHKDVTLFAENDEVIVWLDLSVDVDPDECIIINHMEDNPLLDEMVGFHADQFCN